MYKLYKSPLDNVETAIQKLNSDGSISYIPLDSANTDYQEYLKWLEEGNEPLPAEDPS